MKRHAFTLVELLVVTVIVGILATIALGAYGAAVSEARTRATQSTLFRLQHQTQRRLEALQRLEVRTFATVDGTWEMILVNRTQPSLSLDVKRRLAKKLVLGHYFPQDQSEMWDAALYPPGTTVEDALLRGAQLGDWSPDDALHLTDAWGHSIAFYRWPTRLFAAHPELLPGAYSRDPDDPLCQLQGLFVAGQPHDATMPILMPEACRPYVTVFVSPGPDGLLGMTGPLGDVTDEQAFSDNLFSVAGAAR